jgi:hypothetical protein
VKPYRAKLTLAALIGLALVAPLRAQDPAPPPQPEPARPTRGAITSLEVQVNVSRYQGDKRVSTMPFVLAVNAPALGSGPGAAAQLNVGAEVPIPSVAFTPAQSAGDKPANPLRSYSYRSLGTVIDCRAATADEGRFELTLSVDETSVYTKENAKEKSGVEEAPAFRSFKSRNVLLLRDGQTRQYTAATDRLSGETVRIEVSIKVVK